MTKCRALIKMINKSSNLTSYMDHLKVVHKVRRGLSIDFKSRWNSTKFIMENLLLFKRLIVQLHSDKHHLSLNSKQKQKLTGLELTSDEWRMVSSIDHVPDTILQCHQVNEWSAILYHRYSFIRCEKDEKFLGNNYQERFIRRWNEEWLTRSIGQIHWWWCWSTWFNHRKFVHLYRSCHLCWF